MEQDDSSKRLSLFDRWFGFLYNRLPSDKFLLYVLLTVFVFSSLLALKQLNDTSTVTVPHSGGTLVEGVVGTPRFINPVLAIGRADHDLVALTYSGLMKLDTDGNLVPDLAKDITVSEDGTVYNITLNEDRYFHDGTPLTAADVVFTIGLIQDPELKSPLRGNWAGVVVEELGEYELNLILEDAYAPFLENLTVGILPKHIWSGLSTEEMPFSQHNIEPIGTGPYHVKTITRDRSGLISEYVLAAAPNATSVNIQEIRVRFFTNEETLLEALKTGAINSTAGLNEHLAEVSSLSGYTIQESPLPRVFAIYLNQNKSDLLRDQSVRAALNVALDREAMITQVLNGYGTPAYGPVPEAFFSASSSSLETATDTLAVAAQTLSKGGWEQTEEGTWQHIIDEATTTLAITIRTANSPLFEATARFIEESWSELGVVVNVELYEQSDLVQAVIRPRDYQALLFGADIGRSLDLYPFWHSAEREDPGLNVALYTNITTDKLLQDIRITQDVGTRDELLQQFEQEVTAEAPAIFLFNPSFVYVMKNGITSPPLTRMSRSSERFSSIADWYMDESHVWSIFAD